MQVSSNKLNQYVGQKIREIRQSQDLSQETLAELCGLHRTYIGGVERGERNITLDTLMKISIALKVSVRIIFDIK